MYLSVNLRCGHRGVPAPVRTHWIGLDFREQKQTESETPLDHLTHAAAIASVGNKIDHCSMHLLYKQIAQTVATHSFKLLRICYGTYCRPQLVMQQSTWSKYLDNVPTHVVNLLL